jgi:hypothetical protein
MDEFTDALMVALHAGADDPDRSAMAARMKVLVAELTNQKSTKVKKDAATRELAKVREAYRRALLRA